jgi:hypothetical protein
MGINNYLLPAHFHSPFLSESLTAAIHPFNISVNSVSSSFTFFLDFKALKNNVDFFNYEYEQESERHCFIFPEILN